MRGSSALSSTLLRSRVRREAAASFSFPSATCTSSAAMDVATFIVSSRLFSGAAPMVVRSCGSSGSLNTASPRAPHVGEARERSITTASNGISSPLEQLVARRSASWPSTWLSSGVASCWASGAFSIRCVDRPLCALRVEERRAVKGARNVADRATIASIISACCWTG
eukprot:scaffold40378_cov62-Phaeocystis_antarctica.AAC.1